MADHDLPPRLERSGALSSTPAAAPSTVVPMIEPETIHELFEYVGLGAEDAARLARLGPLLRPAFPAVVEAFYEAIERHPDARAAFAGGTAQIERQKRQLARWLEEIFGGAYDAAYVERHCGIGRTHVRAGVDQRFVFAATSVVRRHLHQALNAVDEAELAGLDRTNGHAAIDRILDLELAMMVETYREQRELERSARERLASLGEVAASIGHELRNPLAVIETSLHLLRGHLDAEDAEAGRHVARIEDQVRISQETIEEMLDLVRREGLELRHVALEDLVSEALSVVARGEGVVVRTELGSLGSARLDYHAMRRILVNLVSNAVQALEAQGRPGEIAVAMRRIEDDLELDVLDNGPGFPENLRAHLFEPLVSGREGGVGMGLAITRRLVEMHGGTIEASNPAPGGALVRIRLPGVFGAAP